MYRHLIRTVDEMSTCVPKTGPIIRYDFKSNFDVSFPYIVPPCSTVDEISACFSRIRSFDFNDTPSDLGEAISNLFASFTINTVIRPHLAEIYMLGFINICYKEDYPMVKCLKFIDSDMNHTRCVNYELDKSQPKRYQFFDVPFIHQSSEMKIDSIFAGNYTPFYQYIEERENFTKQLKRENTIEQFLTMYNATQNCIIESKCDFPSDSINDIVHIPCDCFTTVSDCIRHINITHLNKDANDFFLHKGRFGCYKVDYPIVKCIELSFSYTTRSGYIKRCADYELDETKPKQYQKFDVPFFYDSKNPMESNFNSAVTNSADISSMFVTLIRLITNIDVTSWDEVLSIGSVLLYDSKKHSSG